MVRLADYRGKVVVISFWASWCAPCMKELPVLIGIQKQATRDNLIVLSVNWRENYGKFISIKNALGNADLTLISDRNGGIGLAYDVTAIPHMIVIGKDGKIASIHVGYSDAELPGIVDELNEIMHRAGPKRSLGYMFAGPADGRGGR
jgi:thiol-disulfide isomerase/thioredoxin